MNQLTRLPNGLRVVTISMPAMSSVSVGIWLGVGGRHEPAHWNGISHFIEHMLFKGTRRRTAEQISRAVEGIGGQLNAFTDEEFTCFHARAHHRHFAELLDVLTDMLLESRFAPQEIRKERAVIKEEMAMYLDQPQSHVQEVLNGLLWPRHPLGRPLTGTARTINRIGRAEMLSYWKEHYVAQTAAIVVSGPVEHAAVLKALGKRGRDFRVGTPPPSAPVGNHRSGPAIRLVTKPVEQTQLALGFLAGSRHDSNRYPLRLLNVILGENMSSRLFQVVREDHGLAYSIHSGVTHFDDTGALVISAGVETRTLEKSLKLIWRELQRLTEKSPTAAELDRAKDYVLGQLELALESTEHHMMWSGEQVLAFGRLRTLAEVKEQILSVTPSEVRAVAREVIDPARTNLALVSPLKNSKPLGKLLSM